MQSLCKINHDLTSSNVPLAAGKCEQGGKGRAGVLLLHYPLRLPKGRQHHLRPRPLVRVHLCSRIIGAALGYSYENIPGRKIVIYFAQGLHMDASAGEMLRTIVATA